jgi:hypothetical protein
MAQRLLSNTIAELRAAEEAPGFAKVSGCATFSRVFTAGM